jgi:hypothetical protein
MEPPASPTPSRVAKTPIDYFAEAAAVAEAAVLSPGDLTIGDGPARLVRAAVYLAEKCTELEGQRNVAMTMAEQFRDHAARATAQADSAVRAVENIGRALTHARDVK